MARKKISISYVIDCEIDEQYNLSNDDIRDINKRYIEEQYELLISEKIVGLNVEVTDWEE